ncbi:hypothetical protein LMG28688_05737 [Paraburkholderia caffeinitolerans]|uniref:T6SS Phospholipase effector Tle1-like catalytic domain-containing protein n=1 Tax=Paraburkholderia caffeinitolerans TaxID=1723730 RepID=A0A6J5GPK6_9BURK|nr:DUF2235 domain-containing protein [Paraburkholderia caffeinitolerans]CAB3803275.1 hypothetical protein LMG28688_05737 [Paraburkholderia caffeinitolerans]
MNDNINLLQAAAHPDNTEGVTATAPTLRCRPEKCEFALHIGVFFDGTGNNQDWAEPGAGGTTQLERKKDSNVARLYRAYPTDGLSGYYPVYIPGVGTPFPLIGEEGESALGMGFGTGGDARIVYGLLHVLNAMHRSINNYDTPMMEWQTVKALCSNAWLPLQAGVDGGSLNTLSPADQRELDKVGMKDQGGLLTLNGYSYRTKFLKEQFAQLAQKISETRYPKLIEVFIDVFGFSRGAAQARVFCNWLDECFDGDMLAGVKTHIRFLGIFDTVAAVGLGPAASRWTNGHDAWGETKNLRISPRVRHCEHYVAMHEQRESFPLDDVQTPGDVMPPRCRQFRFPGMHSDLGGGYLPGEQGKNDGNDENKLARMPLNMMYLAARAANVPVDSDIAKIRDGWDAFVISKKLRSDYTAFIQANGTGVRAITDCLIDILAWRYEYRHVYATLPFVQGAGSNDQQDLLDAHRVFMKDIGEDGGTATQANPAQNDAGARRPSRLRRIFGTNRAEDPARTALSQGTAFIPKERREILDRIMQCQPGDVELAFFSAYCHDSYAGFKPFTYVVTALMHNAPRESGGYLQYRTRYAGESLRLAMRESLQQEDAMASIA